MQEDSCEICIYIISILNIWFISSIQYFFNSIGSASRSVVSGYFYDSKDSPDCTTIDASNPKHAINAI